jgi:flagellar basal body-associated protein FliL
MENIETPVPKPTRKKNKKKLIIIAILAVFLLAGSAGATYFLTNRSKKSDQSAQKAIEAVKGSDNQDVKAFDLRKQYELVTALLAESKNRPSQDLLTLYSSAAFTGAQLDEPKAQDYAKEALKLEPADLKQKPDYEQFKSYHEALEAIARGDYGPAKKLTPASS